MRSQRLILLGATQNITVRLTSVLSFDAYTNGTAVQQASGRPPILEIDPGERKFAGAVLSAVLATMSV